MHPWKSYGDTDFITGLRAYAAFAVILVHSGGAGLRQLGSLGQHIAGLGATGVYVFFVISGFSVAASYNASASYPEYLARRLLRIAPLYYVWLLIAAATAGLSYWGHQFRVHLDPYNWFMHLSFLSFLDYRVANSVLGVEWSIPVEVFWYLVLPFLFRLIMRHRLGVPVALVASFCAYLAVRELGRFLPLSPDDAALAIRWSPLPYVFSYCLGVCAYKIRRPAGDVSIAIVLAAAVAYVFVPPDRIDPFIAVSVVTFALICIGSGQSVICRALFTNRVALFLGAISYGVYLSHFPLKAMMGVEGGGLSAFLLIAAAATVVSTLTYYVVEQPCRQLAGRLPRLARA
ncbi:acyltransferase family protein [Ramlibacter alkalitolerans]|uniref:Acyltransferase n=1 Tax=Ramlibacter alkalitolerans TaxID=2039631 RepID=A0ABS1JVB0_9BURK|nr:acyltransferase [Ramlibacter alkalitolerans]MBL0428214.1 acyltransferase [Ramlibacter alkalitolerans]